ncbi:MAG: dTDP-4-dehydrorhamnose 3,5-epimerase family protein [Bacteroidetes bacterium]|nr:dTDP-4-dehydrorhamnose 3,5-epimerase family protein [Bacteroidota bacterium]
MQFREGSIEGVIVKEYKKYSDHRGWLVELYRQDELPLEQYPVMAYVSATHPGVARGPHEHVDQTDFFGFLGPSTFRVYLWDTRTESPTFGNKMVLEVGESNPVAIIVPPGVVHAYRNVGGVDGWVFNAPNRLYAGKGKQEKVDEIRHEDNINSPFILD